MSNHADMVTRSELTEAVRKLRGHFGETQQQFAARMNSAIITVARWETTRPPSGKSLEQLLAIARSEALTECSNLFEQALAGNIESPDSAAASNELFENKRERAFVMALITALRNPEQYRDVTRSVEPALRKVLDEYRADLEAAGVHVPMALAIVQLCNEGQAPEPIAESLEMNVATVQEVLMLDRFGLLPKRKRKATAKSKNRTCQPAITKRLIAGSSVKKRRKVSAKGRNNRRPMRSRPSAHRPLETRKVSDLLEGYLHQEESDE
jgi:transcriptional regulator with XRE-family HTH domain